MGIGRSEPRPASAVLLSRGARVWLGRRGLTRFLPGFSVFPGGGCESGEEHTEAAIRELFEETGVRAREKELTPFARAVTPAFSPYRFDVRVYRLELPAGREPSPDGRELVDGAWFEAEEIFSEWSTGSLSLAPPTLRQLQLWNDCRLARREWPSETEAFGSPPTEDQEILPMGRGVVLVPLRTRAMPPAAWTNAALLGERDLYILDPGGPDVSKLLAQVERMVAEGSTLKGVVLTHHHPDHIEGYHGLGMCHLPLYCHRLTAELLPPDFPLPQLLEEGDSLALTDDLTLRAHFTPGHAPGHLAFELPQTKTVIAGDLISSLSSIVIPSDNGSLRDYLRSLEKLRSLECHLVVPSHGPPYGRGCDPFGQAILHRQKREEQVFRALISEARTPDELTHLIYRGLDPALFPAARANIRHHLWKLRDEGRAMEGPEGLFSAVVTTG